MQYSVAAQLGPALHRRHRNHHQTLPLHSLQLVRQQQSKHACKSCDIWLQLMVKSNVTRHHRDCHPTLPLHSLQDVWKQAWRLVCDMLSGASWRVVARQGSTKS
jgi:hypothetical protein